MAYSPDISGSMSAFPGDSLRQANAIIDTSFSAGAAVMDPTDLATAQRVVSFIANAAFAPRITDRHDKPSSELSSTILTMANDTSCEFSEAEPHAFYATRRRVKDLELTAGSHSRPTSFFSASGPAEALTPDPFAHGTPSFMRNPGLILDSEVEEGRQICDEIFHRTPSLERSTPGSSWSSFASPSTPGQVGFKVGGGAAVAAKEAESEREWALCGAQASLVWESNTELASNNTTASNIVIPDTILTDLHDPAPSAISHDAVMQRVNNLSLGDHVWLAEFAQQQLQGGVAMGRSDQDGLVAANQRNEPGANGGGVGGCAPSTDGFPMGSHPDPQRSQHGTQLCFAPCQPLSATGPQPYAAASNGRQPVPAPGRVPAVAFCTQFSASDSLRLRSRGDPLSSHWSELGADGTYTSVAASWHPSAIGGPGLAPPDITSSVFSAYGQSAMGAAPAASSARPQEQQNAGFPAPCLANGIIEQKLGDHHTLSECGGQMQGGWSQEPLLNRGSAASVFLTRQDLNVQGHNHRCIQHEKQAVPTVNPEALGGRAPSINGGANHGVTSSKHCSREVGAASYQDCVANDGCPPSSLRAGPQQHAALSQDPSDGPAVPRLSLLPVDGPAFLSGAPQVPSQLGPFASSSKRASGSRSKKSSTKDPERAKKIACNCCRTAKIGCVQDDPTAPACDRCIRNNWPCVRPAHRRYRGAGRKALVVKYLMNKGMCEEEAGEFFLGIDEKGKRQLFSEAQEWEKESKGPK
ncbi:hypothetical protein BDZ90DRAFT_5193 [Jaminaea rosea]|uniref:Zn(2)-C6 fungal-type domain-containing protein n=1 Tax=Jaminaea rosea TaxID=1569628 RepID=A0A316UXT3_9BASI|nr:hypothetical protein BDZ90DRAFT_5193 [Jaminaea rosea]PWN30119.1 hypothetical protein BDZ90DRAFT_5193 [Jaminaea rosea]